MIHRDKLPRQVGSEPCGGGQTWLWRSGGVAEWRHNETPNGTTWQDATGEEAEPHYSLSQAPNDLLGISFVNPDYPAALPDCSVPRSNEDGASL